MRQLRFALEDLWENKYYYIRFFIQITCVLIMLGISSSQVSAINVFKNKFKIFQNASDLYIMRDKTETDIIDARLADDSFQRKLYLFYEFLANNEELAFYSYYDDITSAENKELKITYIELKDRSIYYPLLYVDQNFYDVFKITCTDGRNFCENDFSSKPDLIPVLLGAHYDSYYNVGDIINQEYIVIGILDKNAFYLDPNKTDEILYLYDSIIAPLVINEDTPFFQLDRVITSGSLLIKNKKDLNVIEKKSRELEVYDDIEFISFAEQLDNIVESNMIVVYFSLVIQLLILFFCFSCIVSALMNYLNTHKREFSIHIFCGACGGDLALRVMFQVLGCLLLSNIITLIIFGFSRSSLIIVLTSVVLLAFIIFLPLIKIFNKSLSDYMKEG